MPHSDSRTARGSDRNDVNGRNRGGHGRAARPHCRRGARRVSRGGLGHDSRRLARNGHCECDLRGTCRSEHRSGGEWRRRRARSRRRQRGDGRGDLVRGRRTLRSSSSTAIRGSPSTAPTRPMRSRRFLASSAVVVVGGCVLALASFASSGSHDSTPACAVVSRAVIRQTLGLRTLTAPVVSQHGTLCEYYAGKSPIAVTISRQHATLQMFKSVRATAARRGQTPHALPSSFGPYAFYTVAQMRTANGSAVRGYGLTVFRRGVLVGLSAGGVSLTRLEALMHKLLDA